MRAYIALPPAQGRELRTGETVTPAAGRSNHETSHGAIVWAVDPSHPSVESADDREEREFEALSECILLEAATREGTALDDQRIMCMAFDIETAHAQPVNRDDHGDWAHLVVRSTSVQPAAYLVTEMSARQTRASHYAPEVLWFDPTEYADARAYEVGSDGASIR